MREVVVDRDNVNDEFVVVRKLYKQSGDQVATDELVLEIETSKAVTEVRSPEAGVLKVALKEGDEVEIGAVLFEIGGSNGPRETQTPRQAIDPTGSGDLGALESAPDKSEGVEVKVSHAGADLAKRLGINTDRIASRGWMTGADVLKAAGISLARPHGTIAETAKTAASASGRDVPKTPFRAERTSPRKWTEARNLAQANGPGTTSMIAVEAVLPGPRLVEPPFLFQDGISDLVIFEAARLLRRYPDLNAFYLDNKHVGFYEEVNFGVSFDRGHGLKVLALRHADTLALPEIQAAFQSLLQLYEADGAIPEELLTTSTVTLSDLSRSGAHFMYPLLNSDQSLILGVTRNTQNQFRLYGSFDHRVSEGLQVAKFLSELCERIESYFRVSGIVGNGDVCCSVCDRSMQSEVKLGNRGMLVIALPDGTAGHICRNCFEGR